MPRNRLLQLTAVVASCGLIGAAAGIAGSAAAPSKSSSSSSSSGKARAAKRHAFRGMRGGFMMRGRFGGPIHSEMVVPNAAGTGFDTIVEDAGTFASLSGRSLTITEGTDTTKYKDVTLTIPADAKVVRNFKDAQLSDLAAGDHVRVVQGPKGWFVMAISKDFRPSANGPMPGPGGPRGFGPDGDGDGPHGGPPPGGPMGGGPMGGAPGYPSGPQTGGGTSTQ